MRTRRWLARGLAGLVVASVLVACTTEPEKKDESAEPSVPPTGPCEVASERGDVVHTLTVGGKKRSYLLYAPSGLPTETRVPVVYLFHGLGQRPQDVAPYSGLDVSAAENGFIVVAPIGTGDPIGWDLDSTDADPSSDVAFARALAETVVERHCGHRERQFAVGISNGSAFAFELACAGDLPYAAYAGVAFISYGDGCATAPPTSFIYFHGTADGTVPFYGGATPVGPTAAVQESLLGWIAHDACGEAPTNEAMAPDVQRFAWTCPESRIEAFVVDGGGHTWPGAADIPGAGRTTDTVDAADEIVRFFGIEGPA